MLLVLVAHVARNTLSVEPYRHCRCGRMWLHNHTGIQNGEGRAAYFEQWQHNKILLYTPGQIGVLLDVCRANWCAVRCAQGEVLWIVGSSGRGYPRHDF